MFILICFYAILVYKQVRNKASLHLLYSLHVARAKEHKCTNCLLLQDFSTQMNKCLLSIKTLPYPFQGWFQSFTFKTSNCLSKKFTNQIAKMHLINLVFKHVLETQCNMRCINTLLIRVLGRIIDLNHTTTIT